MPLINATPEKIAQLKERMTVIKDDFYLYCAKNLKIRTKAGEITTFVPNSLQRKIADAVIADLAAGLPVRYIILKARQQGMSTIIEAIIYWWTATHKNITSKIVAHEDEAATNIYNMFKRYYDNSLSVFQPATKYNTKHDLTFAHPDDPHKGINSIITTASARNTQVGRSDTIHLLHGSEVAFWADGALLVAGLMQTVPMLRNTMVFLESTANGVGGYYYDAYQAAKRGDGEFKAFFFAWFEHDEYQMPVKEPLVYSEDELELRELYELSDEQLQWRRVKLREFSNDPDRFKQEYPANDMEAFITSGRPRFEMKQLLRMEQHAVAGEFGRLIEIKDQDNNDAIRFEKGDHKAPLQVWKLPEPLGQYCLGGDVAEGLERGDYSVLDVVDRKTMETVARWRGHVDPDVLGDIAWALGTFYNKAIIGIEVNNHGLTTLQRLVDRKYFNLYRRPDALDEYGDNPTAKLGWRTDTRTKPLMIDYLAQAIREGTVHDYDITFIREGMTYVVDENGRTNAQEGCHDDCVIAKAIALQMFEWSFTAPLRKKLPKREVYDEITGRKVS